jgi:tape measure domain-containing protein
MAIATTISLKFNGTAVQRGLASVKKQFAGLNQSISKDFSSLPFASLSNAYKSLGDGLGSIFGSVLSTVKNIALVLTATVIAGIAKLGMDSSKAASNFENMKAQFELFTGSVEKSKDLIDDLREIAVKSPLELADVSEGARMLLTYGVAAEDVAGIVEQLSEVSAGSAERFGRISYAFGQISSLGRLMGTELRQLTEAGFNPLEMISKKTGESMTTLKNRMEDGLIPIEEVKNALKDATSEGGRFYGLNDKMSQTFSGRVSMMRDQWGRLLVDLGAGLNEGLKVAADSLTSSLPMLSEKFKLIGGIIGPAIAEAVSGDYDRFVKIGNFIGEAVKIGFDTTVQSLGTMLVQKWAQYTYDLNKDIPLPGTQIMAGISHKILKQETGTTGDLFAANIQNSKISEMMADLKKNAVIQSDATGYRRANEGEESSLSDAEGNKVIKIEKRGTVPGTEGQYRYAQPGETSVFSDATGAKIIQLFKDAKKDADQPTHPAPRREPEKIPVTAFPKESSETVAEIFKNLDRNQPPKPNESGKVEMPFQSSAFSDSTSAKISQLFQDANKNQTQPIEPKGRYGYPQTVEQSTFSDVAGVKALQMLQSAWKLPPQTNGQAGNASPTTAPQQPSISNATATKAVQLLQSIDKRLSPQL